MKIQNKGKCKYCGVKLPDESNIRCDNCDKAWQEGRMQGVNEQRHKTRLAMKILMEG